MADYLARDEAPLSSEDWEKLDKLVVGSARKRLTGRRFINIFGPLGAGAVVIHKPKIGGIDEDEIAISGRENLSIPMIHKDFRLHWRYIEAANKHGMPLELGPAAVAAAFCAMKEDEMIFNGNEEYGYKGLLNADGRSSVKAQDWKVSGNAFQNVVAAIEKLTSNSFYGPYAMVVSPALYATMHRVYDGTGAMEINMVRELVTDGLFQSPVIKGLEAIVLATGSENMDLVIGQDLITAYLGPDDMDHPFRVFETVLLRIKRPASICAFKTS
jgi:uncharacterized linocin/CFP29 family protein